MIMPWLLLQNFCVLFCWMLGQKGARAFRGGHLVSARSRSHTTYSRNFSLLADNNTKKTFASISSDGTVSGVSRFPGSKQKKKANQKNAKSMSKKDRQRTANGTIQSDSTQTNAQQRTSTNPAQQGIQVVRGNRGQKTVTIVRGMNATPVDEKKRILKLIKQKMGVGGTLVEGVLEIQGGTHVEEVVDILKSLGYFKARKVGK